VVVELWLAVVCEFFVYTHSHDQSQTLGCLSVRPSPLPGVVHSFIVQLLHQPGLFRLLFTRPPRQSRSQVLRGLLAAACVTTFPFRVCLEPDAD